jgi:hypothetical protein
MKYIAIKNIAPMLSGTGDTLSFILSTLEECLSSPDGDKIAIGDKDYSLDAVREFRSLLTEETLVYCGWIEQHSALLTLIEGKTPSSPFEDRYKWLEHTFFKRFSSFLKHFMVPCLRDLKRNVTFEEHAILLSYAVLLPEDERRFIEMELFTPLSERILSSQEAVETAECESALTDVIQLFINDSAVNMVNGLSRASYSAKVNYVDHLLWVVKQQSCTLRLANWILKQLENIELNPEHRQKVIDLKKDLREGRISIKNGNLAPSKGLSLRTIVYLSSIVALIGLSVWIIWQKPFSARDDQSFDNNTAYQQFTKEERVKIDSLLREIQEEGHPEDNQIDPSQPILGNGISVSIRIPFQNKRMEELYRDLQLDVDLYDQGLNDTCSVYSKKEAEKAHYKYVRPLEKRTASFELMMKNESEYDVYMIVFQDETKGKIYSLLIGKGTQYMVSMEANDRVLFVAGNDLGKFITPKGAIALPSKHFVHHFCQTDVNYAQSISNLYSFERPRSVQNKLLFSGDKKTWFTVVDLYSILEVL